MAEAWLSIIGLGEDGLDGLSPASHKALMAAEVVMAPARHLALLGDWQADCIEWPVPFADGLPLLDGLRGRKVAVLTSGDPFWFGAGSIVAQRFAPGEWRTFPAASVFSLAAARLGWPLETTLSAACHAAPFQRLRMQLADGGKMIVTLRDGGAVAALGQYLAEVGFGESKMHVLEALNGPRERVRAFLAKDCDLDDVTHPVAVALELRGDTGLPVVSGLPDDAFDSDGQMTKRPIRALTLSTLAPKPGERLWDIGAGSGSIALEWLIRHPSTQAIAIEARADRAQRISENARVLGQDRLQVVTGAAPDVLTGLPTPDVVFVGGGLTRALLDWLTANLSGGTRLVANAVTLDTEALVTEAQSQMGGALMKIEVSEAQPLGRFRGWKSSYPVVQWSVTL